jgi:hypothetical protein
MSILNASLVLPVIKFIGRLSTMGEKKVVIYVPQEHHKEVLKNFKGKALKITVEEAISD